MNLPLGGLGARGVARHPHRPPRRDEGLGYSGLPGVVILTAKRRGVEQQQCRAGAETATKHDEPPFDKSLGIDSLEGLDSPRSDDPTRVVYRLDRLAPRFRRKVEV